MSLSHFGEVSGLHPALDGASIGAVLSDQSASLFGSGCLNRGDAKGPTSYMRSTFVGGMQKLKKKGVCLKRRGREMVTT